MVAIHRFDAASYLPDPERFEPAPTDEYGEYESVSEGEFDDSLEVIEANLAAWHSQLSTQFDGECPF